MCPMSLVWLELEELTNGRSGVALTQFSSSSSIVYEALVWCFGHTSHRLGQADR